MRDNATSGRVAADKVLTFSSSALVAMILVRYFRLIVVYEKQRVDVGSETTRDNGRRLEETTSKH